MSPWGPFARPFFGSPFARPIFFSSSGSLILVLLLLLLFPPLGYVPPSVICAAAGPLPCFGLWLWLCLCPQVVVVLCGLASWQGKAMQCAPNRWSHQKKSQSLDLFWDLLPKKQCEGTPPNLVHYFHFKFAQNCHFPIPLIKCHMHYMLDEAKTFNCKHKWPSNK